MPAYLPSIRSYLINTNVQLGATYKVSQASTNGFSNGYKVAASFINAQPEEVRQGLNLHSASFSHALSFHTPRCKRSLT